jgi:hypothetical protein
VLPRRCDAHGCVHRVALNSPDPFPKPLEPRRGRPPRLRQDPTARPSSATALMSGHQLLDHGRPSEIWRFIFNRSRSKLGPPIQIRPFLTLSLTRVPAAGSGLSALPWVADTPSPPVSALRAPVRSAARSNLGRLLRIVRSRVPDTPSRGSFA